jgi:hypothetical protein
MDLSTEILDQIILYSIIIIHIHQYRIFRPDWRHLHIQNFYQFFAFTAPYGQIRSAIDEQKESYWQHAFPAPYRFAL